MLGAPDAFAEVAAVFGLSEPCLPQLAIWVPS